MVNWTIFNVNWNIDDDKLTTYIIRKLLTKELNLSFPATSRATNRISVYFPYIFTLSRYFSLYFFVSKISKISRFWRKKWKCPDFAFSGPRFFFISVFSCFFYGKLRMENRPRKSVMLVRMRKWFSISHALTGSIN